MTIGRRSWFSWTLVMMLVAGSAHAQTGTVTGRVAEKGGAPIAGAEVRVDSTTIHASTDGDGHYKLADVPAGRHVVRALMLGYKPLTRAVTVDAGATWFNFSGGLGSINVNALVVDAVHQTLFAGTQAGTFQYSNYPLSSAGVGGGPAQERLSSWPNPFRASVAIGFSATVHERVRLEIFDLAGRRVRLLLDRSQNVAGPEAVSWDGRDDHGTRLPLGVYLVRLRTGAREQCLRLALVR